MPRRAPRFDSSGVLPMLRQTERRVPDWLWSPTDNWARWKGYGRILLFFGAVAYAIGLLGMRMELEQNTKEAKGVR